LVSDKTRNDARQGVRLAAGDGIEEEGNMATADAMAEFGQAAQRQKQAGADQIDQMAKAVHGAADELAQQMPDTAGVVHAAASQLERGAGALREGSISDLMAGFNELGRREPLALLGGAMLAGFAISRFLKSSADSPR
jgi:hypothetical protein